MINKEELKKSQEFFESLRKNSPQLILNPELKSNWDKFLSFFSEKKLKMLHKEDYVLGLDNHENSFCYWVETKLNKLGNMHGATAFKFGIYYGKTDSDPIVKYRFTKKFGSSDQEAFENVKQELIKLLESGKTGSLDELKKNKLSTMFKGKILFLYYPDRFLNVLSNDDLDFFIR